VTAEIAFPPARDLPPGRLEARKRHLLAEIAREPEGPRLPLRPERPALAATVALATLALAGVALAAGFGAFDGLSRAQHPATASDVLPGQTRVGIEEFNAWMAKVFEHFHRRPPRVLPGTARFLGGLPLPGLGKVYVATDTRGSLCIIFESGAADCTIPFSTANPARTYESAWWGDGLDAPVAWGVAIDGITSVSFRSRGQDVTVPVHDNLWYYVGRNTAGDSLTLHLADGSTEVVRHECNGECGSEGPADPGYPAGLPASDRRAEAAVG